MVFKIDEPFWFLALLWPFLFTLVVNFSQHDYQPLSRVITKKKSENFAIRERRN